MMANATRTNAALLAVTAVSLVVSMSIARAEQARFPSPSPQWPEPVNDNVLVPFLLVERLEHQWKDDGADAHVWDIEGWIGGDWNRIGLKSEGERTVDGATQEVQVEALYARRLTPFWYAQAGFRYDVRPEPERGYALVGLQGLTPYWFEVDAAAYVSAEGDLSARFEAEFDVALTQRLFLQPRIETYLSADEVEALGIGEGFNEVVLGLRLRYEIMREFAPYVGVNWTRRLCDTADFAEARGEEITDTAIIAGLRLWL